MGIFYSKKLKGRQLGRTKHKCKHVFKMGHECVDQEQEQWRAFVITVMNIRGK